jgi:hypothetical protein
MPVFFPVFCLGCLSIFIVSPVHDTPTIIPTLVGWFFAFAAVFLVVIIFGRLITSINGARRERVRAKGELYIC